MNFDSPGGFILPAGGRTILLTFDVEDWYQVENLRPWFPPDQWERQQFRAEQNTHRLLDLLDSINLTNTETNSAGSKIPKTTRNPKATFFMLGWIADRMPGLVREIQRRGHEVASHGYNHLMCNQMDEKRLRQDLVRSKKTIEDITGFEVKGYRAPSFSISDAVLDLVRSSGYLYDSSYNSFSRHGRYGTISFNGITKAGVAYKISRDFMELPVSNLHIGKHVVPWGGGGYFRFFPLWIFKAGMHRILKETGTYIFYMHPWEIDPDQPKVKVPNGLSGWRHYLNLNKTCERLYKMISAFKHCKFSTCTQYLDEIKIKVGAREAF